MHHTQITFAIYLLGNYYISIPFFTVLTIMALFQEFKNNTALILLTTLNIYKHTTSFTKIFLNFFILVFSNIHIITNITLKKINLHQPFLMNPVILILKHLIQTKKIPLENLLNLSMKMNSQKIIKIIRIAKMIAIIVQFQYQMMKKLVMMNKKTTKNKTTKTVYKMKIVKKLVVLKKNHYLHIYTTFRFK